VGASDEDQTLANNEGSRMMVNHSVINRSHLNDKQMHPINTHEQPSNSHYSFATQNLNFVTSFDNHIKMTHRPGKGGQRSIALAVKCAQLEGILKLSCCNAFKRISYYETAQKQAVFYLLKSQVKMLKYESCNSSAVSNTITD
jgi:hypothetical protein